MSGVRRHLPALVSITMALAVGVALGGTLLGGAPSDAGPATAAGSSTDHTTAVYGSRFAAAVAPSLYAGRLAGNPVAILTLPGASERTVAGIEGQIRAAGGTVAGRYDARSGLVTPSQNTLVDTLGRRLVSQIPARGAHSPWSGLTTYTRMGRLLATALASAGGHTVGAAPSGTAATIRASLQGAGLMALSGSDTPMAASVVMVLGDQGADAADQVVLAGLTRGLAAGTSRLVVTGDSPSAAGGALAALRRSPAAARITTVDGDESATGQVAVVLALIRGGVGSFGLDASDGAAPLG